MVISSWALKMFFFCKVYHLHNLRLFTFHCLLYFLECVKTCSPADICSRMMTERGGLTLAVVMQYQTLRKVISLHIYKEKRCCFGWREAQNLVPLHVLKMFPHQSVFLSSKFQMFFLCLFLSFIHLFMRRKCLKLNLCRRPADSNNTAMMEARRVTSAPSAHVFLPRICETKFTRAALSA